MELYVTSHLRRILESPQTSISSSFGLRIRETIRKKSLRISAWERCWKNVTWASEGTCWTARFMFCNQTCEFSQMFFFRHLLLQKTSWKPILEMQIFLKICKGCCILGFGILNGFFMCHNSVLIPTLRIRFSPQKLLFWGPKTPLLYRFKPFHWRVQGFLGQQLFFKWILHSHFHWIFNPSQILQSGWWLSSHDMWDFMHPWCKITYHSTTFGRKFLHRSRGCRLFFMAGGRW